MSRLSNVIVLPQIVPPTEIEIREWQGQRVVTLADIDRVHRRPEGTAWQNFNNNRQRFIEGEDYFELNQTLKIQGLGLNRPQGGTPKKVILITEFGYLMLAKSLTDDLAWQVQRSLVHAYFRVKETMRPPVDATILKHLAATLQATAKVLPRQTNTWPIVRALYEAAGIEVPETLPGFQNPSNNAPPDWIVELFRNAQNTKKAGK